MKYLCLSLLVAAVLRAAEPVAVDALVAQTVADHPELRFYAAEVDAARADLRAAGAWADPELSVSAGRKRVRDTAGTLAGEGTAWTVSVAQTFEWPGRLALRKAIANGEVELAELGLARFRAALAARTRLLAHGLAAAREEAAATAEVAARYRELREVFLQRDPAGLTPLLETRVIEAQELVLQRRATAAALAEQAALLELNQLRGAAPDAPLTLAAPALRFRPAPEPAALLATAREHNFDYRAAELELAQQGRATSLARHERRPAVTVSPYVSQESAGDRERVVGVGLSLPLPLSPRGGAAVAAASARERQAAAAQQVAALRLEREVTTTVQTYAAKLAEAAGWAPDSATRFREAAALADRHYRLGAVPLATYVELQASYLDAVEALLATQREALEAGLRLDELTAGAFRPLEGAP